MPGLVATLGDLLTCDNEVCPDPSRDGPYEPQGAISTAAKFTYAGGRPIARQGDQGQCGGPNTLVTGSKTVFVEGQPVHRQGDKNTCNGSTITGRPNIIIGDWDEID